MNKHEYIVFVLGLSVLILFVVFFGVIIGFTRDLRGLNQGG